MPENMETLIDLIRHGEPEGGSMYRGHNIDHPLSEKGWQQMRDATSGKIPWNEVISSPMLRCSRFAQELANAHKLSVTIEHDFREVGFGEWEGKTREQLRTERLQEYEDFYHDPVHCRPPGSEDLNAFIQRVTSAYQLQTAQHGGKHILIVAHAGVIRAIIAHTLHSKPLGLYRIKVENGLISRIKIDKHGGHLLQHNVRLADMC